MRKDNVTGHKIKHANADRLTQPKEVSGAARPEQGREALPPEAEDRGRWGEDSPEVGQRPRDHEAYEYRDSHRQHAHFMDGRLRANEDVRTKREAYARHGAGPEELVMDRTRDGYVSSSAHAYRDDRRRGHAENGDAGHSRKRDR